MARNSADRRQGLQASLLGPPEVLVDGIPIQGLYSRKGLWLFALLALRAGREVERAWLAVTLWPDAEEETGLYYLRRELHRLRKALGAAGSRIQAPTSRVLLLDLDTADLDVLEFDRLGKSREEADLIRAATLYRGPLLEGCGEEWALGERENRELIFLRALDQLAEISLSRGDWKGAIGTLRRIVATDPLRESVHRSLIRAYASDGDVAAARQAYRNLRLLLHRELNVAPDQETIELVAQIRLDIKQRAIESAKRLEAEKGNAEGFLPVPLTSLVGRTEELALIAEKLGKARLVTLLGTGGVGKTRLALEAAESLRDGFANGAWFVDLAPISDSALVAQTIAATLSVRQDGVKSIEDVLCRALQSRQLLLVLDNCEQVLTGVAQFAHRLLGECRGVKVLATSRQSLGAVGEWTLRVPSLQVPSELDPSADASTFDAVRLFAERAAQASGTFTLTPKNSADIGQICRRLDGIPLAIELAAARVQGLSLSQIIERLSDRFALLEGSVRSGLPRQQTLRASVDWSYDLLTEREQGLFRELSVFAGGFTGAQAGKVCQGVDCLPNLVEKSLVTYDEWQDRYAMLETVRQYAAERLEESGAGAETAQRHLECFLAIGLEAEPHLMGAEQLLWCDRLEADLDNLRSALGWSRGHAPEQGLKLASAICRFWSTRGYNLEALEWIDRLLGSSDKKDSRVAAEGLYSAAVLALAQGDGRKARAYADGTLELGREIGDLKLVANALNVKANVAHISGDYAEEQVLRAEGLAICRELGDEWGIAVTLGNLGLAHYIQSDFRAARDLQHESLAIRRRLGIQRGIAYSLHILGLTEHALRNHALARSCFEESLAIDRALGHTRGVATTLKDLGWLCLDEGDGDRATAFVLQSLKIFYELGDELHVLCCLELIASIASSAGDVGRAATLWGSCEHGREVWGSPRPPNELPGYQSQVFEARLRMNEAEFDQAWAEGRSTGISGLAEQFLLDCKVLQPF